MKPVLSKLAEDDCADYARYIGISKIACYIAIKICYSGI